MIEIRSVSKTFHVYFIIHSKYSIHWFILPLLRTSGHQDQCLNLPGVRTETFRYNSFDHKISWEDLCYTASPEHQNVYLMISLLRFQYKKTYLFDLYLSLPSLLIIISLYFQVLNFLNLFYYTMILLYYFSIRIQVKN